MTKNDANLMQPGRAFVPQGMKDEQVKNGGEGSGNFGHSGRPGEVGGSGDGGISKETKTIGKGIKQEIYSIDTVKGSELQIVTNDLGQRSVATFLIPKSEQGKGYGQSLLLHALKEGDIRASSTGGVSDAYQRVQDKLVTKGLAHIVKDEYDVKFLKAK